MSQVKLVLENGNIYHGTIFAKGSHCFGEVIFNTAMSGYEEVLTDPSYKEQLVVLTYPQIGNYGINEKNIQSKQLHLNALIVKEYLDFPSNWQSTKSLKTYLEEHNIIGIEGIDTRHLTRTLRQAGALNGFITTSTAPEDQLIQEVKNYIGITGKNLAKEVSTNTPYQWNAPSKKSYKVAVIDCGVKFSILKQLSALNCDIHVFPYNTPAETILSADFDGVLISNGPGDPSAVTETIECINKLLGKIPLFGICLGHQMLSIATGFNMKKLPFGHHGLNHPIKNLSTNKIEITSQNHIYCASQSEHVTDFNVSHLNLNDHTIAGIRSDEKLAFSVQYHPESAPGPSDSHYLFEEFIHLMKHRKFSTDLNSVVNNKGYEYAKKE